MADIAVAFFSLFIVQKAKFSFFLLIISEKSYTDPMSKNEIIIALEKLDSDLGILIKNIDSSGFLGLQGTLHIKNDGEKVRFYKKLPESRVYLGKDKEKTIINLSKKMYYTRLRAMAEQERKQIARCLKILKTEGTSIDEAFDGLNESIKKYITPIGLSDEGYSRLWLKQNRPMTRQMEGQHKTLNGEYVKSKSEVIIADRLAHYKIPYVYEVATFDDNWDNMRKPDFLILNKRTRQVFFWEHLGRMGDSRYAAENQVKLESFAKQGIILGKNLILSIECSDRPLSTEYVDTLIKQLLM